MIVILLALYFIPALVAAVRGHHQTIPIGILNLFFGWTLVGWVAALIWAVSALPSRPGAISYTDRKCPHCAEMIKREAVACRHCGRDVEPQPYRYEGPPARPAPRRPSPVLNLTETGE